MYNMIAYIWMHQMLSECKNITTTVQKKEHVFATKLNAKKPDMWFVLHQVFSTPISESGISKRIMAFDVNKTLVHSFRKFGKGHATME
jgi:hypothetical protein